MQLGLATARVRMPSTTSDQGRKTLVTSSVGLRGLEPATLTRSHCRASAVVHEGPDKGLVGVAKCVRHWIFRRDPA